MHTRTKAIFAAVTAVAVAHAPVAAAVFRRGEAVWIVFDAAARLDLTGARALGPARDARWAAGPDYTVVRLAAPDPTGVRPV